jgi:proline iminopeptidase
VSEALISADDGCALWTARSGSGPPLVLCHGGPGMWDYLAPVAAMLDDRCTVYRWDQRGGGRSGAAPPYSTQRFEDDLEALRAGFGHERWMVGGHSWGATLALTYALRFPERVSAVLYISGTGIGAAWREA